MSQAKDRAEFIHFYMKYAPLTSFGRTEGDLARDAKRLMRYAATFVRIETELTNGYKTKDGQWDQQQTDKSILKRLRIEDAMERLAPIVYGALTVSVRMGNREFYIPAGR